MKPDEGATYLAFAQLDEVGGRFAAALGPTHVVGATAAPAPVAGGKRDPTPPEKSLGYCIDELEPGSFSPAQEALEPSMTRAQGSLPNPASTVAPSAFDVEERDVGLGLSRPYRRF
jgi:hypothetical protein